mmetsp:Transcript_4838/g.11451  ORF Transcript_4838/g.11451 Transcript_4838/m.11451 type:complete len:1099 (-) Transcript_4838:28-3324(-)
MVARGGQKSLTQRATMRAVLVCMVCETMLVLCSCSPQECQISPELEATARNAWNGRTVARNVPTSFLAGRGWSVCLNKSLSEPLLLEELLPCVSSSSQVLLFGATGSNTSHAELAMLSTIPVSEIPPTIQDHYGRGDATTFWHDYMHPSSLGFGFIGFDASGYNSGLRPGCNSSCNLAASDSCPQELYWAISGISNGTQPSEGCSPYESWMGVIYTLGCSEGSSVEDCMYDYNFYSKRTSFASICLQCTLFDWGSYCNWRGVYIDCRPDKVTCQGCNNSYLPDNAQWARNESSQQQQHFSDACSFKCNYDHFLKEVDGTAACVQCDIPDNSYRVDDGTDCEWKCQDGSYLSNGTCTRCQIPYYSELTVDKVTGPADCSKWECYHGSAFLITANGKPTGCRPCSKERPERDENEELCPVGQQWQSCNGTFPAFCDVCDTAPTSEGIYIAVNQSQASQIRNVWKRAGYISTECQWSCPEGSSAACQGETPAQKVPWFLKPVLGNIEVIIILCAIVGFNVCLSALSVYLQLKDAEGGGDGEAGRNLRMVVKGVCLFSWFTLDFVIMGMRFNWLINESSYRHVIGEHGQHAWVDQDVPSDFFRGMSWESLNGSGTDDTLWCGGVLDFGKLSRASGDECKILGSAELFGSYGFENGSEKFSIGLGLIIYACLCFLAMGFELTFTEVEDEDEDEKEMDGCTKLLVSISQGLIVSAVSWWLVQQQILSMFPLTSMELSPYCAVMNVPGKSLTAMCLYKSYVMAIPLFFIGVAGSIFATCIGGPACAASDDADCGEGGIGAGCCGCLLGCIAVAWVIVCFILVVGGLLYYLFVGFAIGLWWTFGSGWEFWRDMGIEKLMRAPVIIASSWLAEVVTEAILTTELSVVQGLLKCLCVVPERGFTSHKRRRKLKKRERELMRGSVLSAATSIIPPQVQALVSSQHEDPNGDQQGQSEQASKLPPQLKMSSKQTEHPVCKGTQDGAKRPSVLSIVSLDSARAVDGHSSDGRATASSHNSEIASIKQQADAPLKSDGPIQVSLTATMTFMEGEAEVPATLPVAGLAFARRIYRLGEQHEVTIETGPNVLSAGETDPTSEESEPTTVLVGVC